MQMYNKMHAHFDLLNVISSSTQQPPQAHSTNLTVPMPPSGQQCEIQIPINILIS